MKIGVNGITSREDIRMLESMDIDIIGYDFRRESQRLVRMVRSRAGIIPDYSKDRIDKALKRSSADSSEELDRGDEKKMSFAGFFFNDMPQSIITRIFNFGIQHVILCGDEEPLMIDNLRRTLVPDLVDDISIIKTVQVAPSTDFNQFAPYAGCADALLILLDSSDAAVERIHDYQLDVPFYIQIADGNGVEQVCEASHHKLCKGIFLDGFFDTANGSESVAKISHIVNRFRTYFN